MPKIILAIGLIGSLFGCTQSKEKSNELKSPSGNFLFYFSGTQEELSEVRYAVIQTESGDTLIEQSSLGLSMNEAVITPTYRLVHSTKTSVRDGANCKTFSLLDENNDTLKIEVKAFDDGIAFRYQLGLTDDKQVFAENTSFNLTPGKAWIQPYDKVTKWTPGYEQAIMETKVGVNSPNEEGWCFPVLSETKRGDWIFISESGLDGSYPAMHLQPRSPEGNYLMRMPEVAEADSVDDPVIIAENWRSPWRFITIGKTLQDIFSADMVSRLAPEPQENYDWVKPGRSSWSWWSDHDSSKDPVKLRSFIDLAAEMSWEYSLIDANWNEFPTDSLKSLIQYADDKEVGLWLWYNSGGPHNIVTEAPRDLMHIGKIRRAEFAKLQKLGIKGVKIDFFQSDKKKIIEQYMDILEDAADFQIMLNFHGSTLPRGWSTTYPHLLTMESVRGAETYSFNAEWPAQAPRLNTTYPFTRNLTGPMDYTPVTFTQYPNGRVTTDAHELALSIIFTSDIQHFADSKEGYETQPEEVKEFLRNVPTVWDESRLIDGYPGDYVVIARRKDERWYIAGINGKEKSRTIQIDLSEFSTDQFALITDSKRGFKLSTIVNSLTIEMDGFSGFVGYIK